MDSLSDCTSKGSADENQDIRTLFVSGLPNDVNPRELYFLFRTCRGYISSTVRSTNKPNRPLTNVGFVTFSSRECAEEAKKLLQNFSSEPPYSFGPLRLEIAKQNTKSKQPGFIQNGQFDCFRGALPNSVMVAKQAGELLGNNLIAGLTHARQTTGPINIRTEKQTAQGEPLYVINGTSYYVQKPQVQTSNALPYMYNYAFNQIPYTTFTYQGVNQNYSSINVNTNIAAATVTKNQFQY